MKLFGMWCIRIVCAIVFASVVASCGSKEVVGKGVAATGPSLIKADPNAKLEFVYVNSKTADTYHRLGV